MRELTFIGVRVSELEERLRRFIPPVATTIGGLGICEAVAVGAMGATLLEIVLLVAHSSLAILAGVVVRRRASAPLEMGVVNVDPREGDSPASRAFNWMAVLTPRRIWNEDVGDAIETICAMERAGCSRFAIKAKIVSTYCWVFVVTIRELVTALVKVPLR